MNKEKVIKGLEQFKSDFKPFCGNGSDWAKVDAAIALLKEDCHNCKLECLLQKYDELKEKYDKQLKAKEATIDILVKAITFHNCNNCNRKDCDSKPNASQPVRSNCIYWLEGRWSGNESEG